MSGRLIGIARHARPKGPIEVLDHAHVGLATGIEGDFRGAIRPGKSNRRQVTLMMASDWAAAMDELGTRLDWAERRVNLLVEGVVLPRHTGARIRIGNAAVMEVMGECDPCSRMEGVCPGLKAALTPDWRGGRISRVVAEGEIRLGDAIAVEED